MARRHGRKGQWLVSDDYTGQTHYSSEMQTDYWGNIVKRPLKRNLQEIASPLTDPEPIPFYRGPTYETVDVGTFKLSPLYVGNTLIKTKSSYAGDVLGYDVGAVPFDCNTVVACAGQGQYNVREARSLGPPWYAAALQGFRHLPPCTVQL